jgi:catechol 2,3-dioxygenase-like lactoylglutathione lyase family enzyme
VAAERGFAKLVPELVCSDLARSLRFYTESAGFRVLYERA